MPNPMPSYQIPEGHRLYVVGDIHGMAGLLERRFAAIDADQSASPGFINREIYLGDYVDRGPDSRRVLHLLMERHRQRDVVAITGNHEIYMLRAQQDPETFERWMRFGGRETLVSFGVRPPDGPPSERNMAEWREAMSPEEKNFLGSLQPWHRFGDYAFVHAGFRPGIALEDQTIEDMTTIREPFLSNSSDFGFRVVHGHTPRADVEFRPGRINLDTGAFMSGRLSCLVIEPARLRLL